ncbi:YdcF family protein [Glacieibacterium frigidum]|uniref:YdcF family protein n=1 Tax=Glacieibacterium frigidum TaxID=2593303 RepID=UPI001F2909BF|nr:YdcF family protein [Glacieibacterium frigidum]
MIGAVVRLVAAVALAWGLGFVWFIVTLATATPVSVATDAVVVLTGGPGRVARGFAVLEAGSAKRMLVSGVGRGVTDAELAATVDAPPALFERDVDLGFAAIDTRSNAEETTAWMVRHQYRSLRLVTSAAHMKRARLELEARLPRTVTILPDAVPVDPAAPSLAREFNKYALRWAALQVGVA